MASLVIGALPMASKAPSLSSLSRSQTLVSLPLTAPPSIPISISASSSTRRPFIYCGRGDRKTARGKRFNHSFGNARPRRYDKGRGPPRVPVPPSTQKKDRFNMDDFDYNAEEEKTEDDDSQFFDESNDSM